jgi:ABC-type spermidine/putrescine transport system permease subunit II
MEPMQAQAPHRSLAQTAWREFTEIAGICGYLYVCFGALIFYKASILHSHGVEFVAYGLALGKALILGKFVLVAHALGIGDRNKPRRLVLAILLKSLIFALLLVALSVVEEVIVGFFKGRPVQESLKEIAGGTLAQVLATSFLILLIMIPYIAFREMSAVLGKGELVKLLTERR